MTIGRKHFNSIDMRKSNIFLLFAIFSASLFSGCDKAIISPDPESQEEEVCFTAELASPVEIDALTRVAVGSSPSIVWSTGDKIGVFNSSAQSEFTLTEGAGETHGKFNGFIDNSYGNGPFFAYYPYSASVSKAGSKINGLSVPDFQLATKGSYDPTAAPMVAYTTDKTVYFKHVCSFVKITVANKNEDFKYLSRITIKSKNGEAIAGTCSATVNTDNSVIVGDYGAASSSVILSAPSGGFIEPGIYYIAVLPATLANGYEVIFDTSKYTYRRILKDGLPARVFERAHVRNLGSFAKDWTWTDVKDQEILYGGNYQQSDGTRIYFAKGNLQAVMNSSNEIVKWQFATHQYDYIGNDSGNAKLLEKRDGGVSFANNDIVDLFAWQQQDLEPNSNDPLKKYGINNESYNSTTGIPYLNRSVSGGKCDTWADAINNNNIHTWSMISSFELNHILTGRAKGGAHGSRDATSCTITLVGGKKVSGYWMYPNDASGISTIPSTIDLNTEQDTYDEFEAKGCVFLPKAGYATGGGTSTGNLNTNYGKYWCDDTDLSSGKYLPKCLNIYTTFAASTNGANSRQSVRLVIKE